MFVGIVLYCGGGDSPGQNEKKEKIQLSPQEKVSFVGTVLALLNRYHSFVNCRCHSKMLGIDLANSFPSLVVLGCAYN